jgi:hypothetical protein
MAAQKIPAEANVAAALLGSALVVPVFVFDDVGAPLATPV